MSQDKDVFVRLAAIATHYKKAPIEVLSDFLDAAESVMGTDEKPKVKKATVSRKKMSSAHRKAISVGRRLAHARKVLAGLAR